MSRSRIDGSPRDDGDPTRIHTGSRVDETTLTMWRSDGIDFASSFDGRAADAGP